MANAHIEALNDIFDNNPSMNNNNSNSNSTENENRRPGGGVLRLPSHRSGFAAGDDTASEVSSNAPDSPWSPPAWRPPETSSAWYRHQPYLQESPMPRSSGRNSLSRGPSVLVDDEDITVPANIPLPKGSESPQKEHSPEPRALLRSSALPSPASPGRQLEQPRPADTIRTIKEEDETAGMAAPADHVDNYIRFSVRADVQQRTAPLEQAILALQGLYLHATASRRRLVWGALAAALSAWAIQFFLFRPPPHVPRPDLIKVASFARNFEPLLHFSEHGVQQLGDLQESSTAVWDLSESIRVANLTSSPIIVSELEGLGDSLRALASELTGFFASVDGDFDNILLVMDWARRELAHLDALQPSAVSMAVGNLHSGLTSLGVLSAADPTSRRNAAFTAVFGMPHEQRAVATLQRTFIELLGTLEQSIDDELVHAQAILAIYATIELQFTNLNRATAREFDTQESLHSEILGSLWERVMGRREGKLRLYERNKELLHAVRRRTVQNKQMLVEHNQRLVALKQNLEMLRRRLVGPVLQVPEEATGASAALGNGRLGLEEQVRGLEETGEHLRRVRQEQKEKVMGTLYGSGARNRQPRFEIEGR